MITHKPLLLHVLWDVMLANGSLTDLPIAE